MSHVPIQVVDGVSHVSPPVKITMTALENRRRFFLDRLKSTTLFLLQTIVRVVFQTKSADPKKKQQQPVEVRDICRKAKMDEELFNQFYTFVSKEYSHLGQVVEMAVSSYVEVMQLTSMAIKDVDGTYIAQPLRRVWTFLLQVIFEKPKIICDEQDVSGSNLDCVKEAWIQFLSEITPINFDLLYTAQQQPRLTADVLQQHNQKEEESQGKKKSTRKEDDKLENGRHSPSNTIITPNSSSNLKRQSSYSENNHTEEKKTNSKQVPITSLTTNSTQIHATTSANVYTNTAVSTTTANTFDSSQRPKSIRIHLN